MTRDGKIYGKLDGPFLHRWWNYYERALSFADGHFWKEAELDLLDAISRRKEDKRRARMMGMHFMDYFPQRELGIVYFKQGRLKEAIEKLEYSLSTQESEKAMIYLNRAREQYIMRQNLDIAPPEIHMDAPGDNALTNAISIIVKGTVSDDTYVSHISVKDTPLTIRLSQKNMPFSQEVPLEPGLNLILVTATDISGKQAQKILKVRVDRLGPVVSVESPIRIVSGTDKVAVHGIALDQTGLDRIIFDNGATLSCRNQKEFKIRADIPVSRDQRQINLTVIDVAGNKTIGTIALTKQTIPSPGISDHMPPVINFRNADHQNNQVTYLDQAVIEGYCRDDHNISKIYIDDKQILARPVSNVFFSRIVGLKQGKNTIPVKCIDTSGNTTSEEYVIYRQSLAVYDIGARLRVGVDAFKRKIIGENRGKSYGIENMVIRSMKNRKRFSIVDRSELKKIIDEITRGQTGLVDENTAIEAGHFLSADCLLFASVLERQDSLEVYARLVDTETTEVLATADAYGEDIKIGSLEELGQDLDIKLSEELPVVEGKVAKVDGEEMIINFGKNKGVRQGMKIIAYTVGDAVTDPDTGNILGLAVTQLAQARIRSVEDKMSYADIYKHNNPKCILPTYHVITR